MTWWFLILGMSSLVVLCVAIALYMRVRRHLRATQTIQELTSSAAQAKRFSAGTKN